MTALPESLIERWPILPVAFGKPAEITAALSPPFSTTEGKVGTQRQF